MLIEEILSELPRGYEMPPREVKWIEEMLHYNVKGGKMNRGKMVVASMIELAKHQGVTLSPEEISRYSHAACRAQRGGVESLAPIAI